MGRSQDRPIPRLEAGNPDVLLFDEPTAALDSRTQQWLLDLVVELHRAGKTIVSATHDPREILADDALLASTNLRLRARTTERGRSTS